MERIVLDVDETTAKKWCLSSRKRKTDITQQIRVALAKELIDSPEEFQQFLDEMRNTMKERGLTEKALQEILNDA